jgi:trehalose 6-phosphate phosphatase
MSRETKFEAGMSSHSLPEIDFARDALLFDVDGTLLDLAPKPEDVHVPQSLRKNLETLNRLCDGAVALVSGRKLAIIDGLFLPLSLTTIGAHGAELQRVPGGPIEQCAPPLPEYVRKAFADLGHLDPRIVVEDKTYTLAFHCRAARDRCPELVQLAREKLKPFAPEFVMLCGKDIVEIKSAAFSKGTALRGLFTAAPFEGRRPIYCGDDTTDEDAFKMLPEFGGLGVSVGHRMAGAAFTVPAPVDIRNWLARIAAQNGGRA